LLQKFRNLREGRQKQTIVGGAKGLSDAVPCLSKIGSMGGNSIYNIVGLRARKLLYKQNLEIFTEIITKGHCGFLFPFYQSKKEVHLAILPQLSRVVSLSGSMHKMDEELSDISEGL